MGRELIKTGADMEHEEITPLQSIDLVGKLNELLTPYLDKTIPACPYEYALARDVEEFLGRMLD